MNLMKILLSNFAYGMGGDGSYSSYVTSVFKYLFTKQEVQSAQTLARIIADNEVDIVCIAEIHKGLQMNILSSSFDGESYVDTKYGDFLSMPSLFFGKKKANAVLVRNESKVEKMYFSVGTKKLIYRISIDEDTDMYFTHFSLSGEVRKKQFRELAEVISGEKKNIICGDFNIFSGIGELEELCNISDMRVVSPKNTFPAYDPKYPLDIFLASNTIEISTEVVDEIFSDHLAVVATL